MKLRSTLAGLMVLAALVSCAAAQAPNDPAPPESRAAGGKKQPKPDPSIAIHAEAVKTLVASLDELAAWSEKQKLDRERAKALDLILVFEPENEAARAGLGFVKGKTGAWERSPKWKEPSNRDNEDLKDYKQKRAEIGSTFLDAMSKMIEEHRRDIDSALKARVIGDMNAIDPNDPRTRTVAGEALLGGKWVLAETAGAAARRKQLQGWAAAAIKAAGKPEPAEPMGNEGNWDIKWASVVTTENLRVLATSGKEEAERVAILCQAAGELFGKTFDTDVPHQSTFKTPIYLIGDPTAKANFLLRNPSIKPAERDHYAKLGGFGIDGSHVIWGAEQVGRTDLAVRRMIGSFMGRSFGINGSDEGALYEGIGIHLTWYLTETRLSWTIGKRKYAQSGKDGLEDKLRKADAEWFSTGYDLVGGKNHPPLKPLLAKHLNDLESEDVLAAFMLGVWLVDGRKDDAPRFLRAAGRNEHEKGALSAFGLSLNELEERWVRWAKEMRSVVK